MAAPAKVVADGRVARQGAGIPVGSGLASMADNRSAGFGCVIVLCRTALGIVGRQEADSDREQWGTELLTSNLGSMGGGVGTTPVVACVAIGGKGREMLTMLAGPVGIADNRGRAVRWITVARGTTDSGQVANRRHLMA